MIPLRTGHVAYYAIIVTLSFALAATVGYALIRREMLAANDFFLDIESKEMLARLSPLTRDAEPAALEKTLREHAEDDSAVFYFEVQTRAGKALFRSHNLGTNPLPETTLEPEKRTVDVNGLGLMRVADYPTAAGDLQIAMSLGNFRRVNERFVMVLLVGLPLIALFSIAVGLRLRRSTLKPVRLMQAAAGHIHANNLGERIPIPPGDGEMAGLARLLNQMFDRLENSFKQIKRFTADTSHELMTPLSVIRLHVERLQSQPGLPEPISRSLEEQLQEISRLGETLEKLMVLTKADSSALPLKLSLTSTADFVANFAEDATLLAESKGRHFIVGRNEPADVRFDQGWIRQVLLNLLSNALRFSPPGGTITLSSSCDAGQWTVEVCDEGPGVPPHRLGELFQRFTQIRSSHESHAGCGLGLAICKSIVELHQGAIEARNRTDRTGFIVAFHLPLMGQQNRPA